ncbi:MAG: hypothetical protein ACRDSJ_05940, partial [Rubrobacteraceae bacterium]
MSWLRKVWTQPWWVAISAVGGLLVSIAIAGLVGLWLNERVDRRTDEARYDVELEAQVDDLRLAIFDLRLDHRDIAVEGPSEDALDEWEAANVALREEIDELEEVEVRVPELPQPDEFRLLADDYREGFRSAAEVHDSDPEEFERASGRSLDTLYRIEDEALEIDALADELAVEALDGVDRATVTSRFALAAVLVGLFLAGAALAYA